MIGDKIMSQLKGSSLADLERLKTYEQDRQHLVLTMPEFDAITKQTQQAED